MNLSEYLSFDGLGLAGLIRTGQVKAEELRDLALIGMERINPTINAVIGLAPSESDRALRERDRNAQFSGVPFLIKDIGAHMSNIPSELGSRLTKGLTLSHDSELAARFKKAGLVTLGRTNTPEFGCSASTEPVLYGATRNPWNLLHTPGGSSGGSAAAVAAGIVPIAHANDGGGSIRVPASCCGLFGMKPSRGRNPAGPDQDDLIFGLGAEHVVTRTVRDSAAMLDATHGADIGARYLLPTPSISFLDSSQRDPQRLRIAFSTKAPHGAPDVDDECRRAVLETAKLCEKLGHDVFEGEPNIGHDESCAIFRDIAGPIMASTFKALSALLGRTINSENLEVTTLAVFNHGMRMSAVDLTMAIDGVNAVSRKLGHFFSSCDLWLSPVLTTPPVKLGVLNANEEGLDATQWIKKTMDFAPFCAMFNGSGQPAMSIPLHWTKDGLPVGVQFAARFGEESTLFSLAGQLERARPWIGRISPHSVLSIPA